jgi:hypothetical protein
MMSVVVLKLGRKEAGNHRVAKADPAENRRAVSPIFFSEPCFYIVPAAAETA